MSTKPKVKVSSNLTSNKNEDRLRRKLKLQEMRSNLLSTEMKKLKSVLSEKNKQLETFEEKLKKEERKRRFSEKKLREIKRKLIKLAKEKDEKQKEIEEIKQKLASQPESINLIDSSPVQETQKNKKSKKAKKLENKLVKENSAKNKQPQPHVQSQSKENQIVQNEPQPSTSSGISVVNCGLSCSGLPSTIVDSSKLEELFENELMCAICHELYIKPVALNCSHIFCAFCINQWRQKAHKCPVCRKLIFGSSPQVTLENVIDKIVTKMDEESQKRRAEVVRERPAHQVQNTRNRRFNPHSLFGSLTIPRRSLDSSPRPHVSIVVNPSDEDSSYSVMDRFGSPDSSMLNGMAYFESDDTEDDDDDENDDDRRDRLGFLRGVLSQVARESGLSEYYANDRFTDDDDDDTHAFDEDEDEDDDIEDDIEDDFEDDDDDDDDDDNDNDDDDDDDVILDSDDNRFSSGSSIEELGRYDGDIYHESYWDNESESSGTVYSHSFSEGSSFMDDASDISIESDSSDIFN